MGSRSGQANEAGSVHRRGVALFLAAHGLASRPVADADPRAGNPTPVALAFETSHATDDLQCTLSDGSRLFISAKRSCGNNAHLVDTVEQWLSQVDELRPGDRLVLATAEPTGIVRHLGGALRRYRAAPTSVFPVPEQEALTALRARMVGTATDKQERVLGAAVVLVIDAAAAGRVHHDLAGALLEGTVVPAGSGPIALSHLEGHMHTQAGSAYSGDVESWVRHLADLGVPVFADRSGPAAAAARARQTAVTNYCLRLKSVAGQVDLSLLAEDLEPLIVDDLVDHIQATVDRLGDERESEKVRFLALARHVPRLLLEGLPGSGKSAAITQLAARWSADPAAPLPVVVRLRELAPRCQASPDVSLALLCEVAAARAPENERLDLIDGMHAAIAQGEAVLLLDGLDECLDRRALVAQGLKQVLADLPTETGVLLTTRPSGLTSASRFSLPVARLSMPDNLHEVLNRLLHHVAETRIASSAREAWVAERQRRAHEIRTEHKELGSVPLLAVLITLAVADDRAVTVPATTAGLLRNAVTRTIDRWERRRPHLPEGMAVRPTDGQLLAGFAATGYLLSHRGATPLTDVQLAISSALMTRWELAPEPAEEVSRTVQWFWDDHVGVFVLDETDSVVPRSRAFAEIGAAMWCPSMSDDELRAWVSSGVLDTNRHMALLLAAELDPRVVTELLTPSDQVGERCRLAARAVRNGVAVSTEQIELLLSQLMDEATRAAPAPADVSVPRPGTDTDEATHDRRRQHDGPVWPWALEIARLPIPASLDERRVALLTALVADDNQRHIALGIAALASANCATRPLTVVERDQVFSMLSVPLPPKAEARTTRRTFTLSGGRPLTAGLAQAVTKAASRLPELDPKAIELISALAMRASTDDAINIAIAMDQHGHHLKLVDFSQETVTSIRQMSDGYRNGYRSLLETMARLSSDEVRLTPSQRWRLPDVCDLLNVLEVDRTSMPDFWTLTQSEIEETRTAWMRCMSLAAGLDLALVGEEARAALAEVGDGDIFSLLELFHSAPDEDDLQLDLRRLDSEDVRWLFVGALVAESDWIAHSATRLLWDAEHNGLENEVVSLLESVPPSRRFLLATLAWRLSEEPGSKLITFFESTDPPLRRAAASISRREEGTPEIGALRERALVDEDATIRQAAGAITFDGSDVPAPERWSCRLCAAFNDLATEDCHGCDQGTRPRPDND